MKLKGILATIFIVAATTAPFIKPEAATNSFRITVKTGTSDATDVDLIDRTGKLYPGSVTPAGIRFKVPLTKLNGASLIAYKDGQLVGPVGKRVNNKLQFRFKAKPTSLTNTPISKVTITLATRGDADPYIPATVAAKVFAVASAVATSSITPLGINFPAPGALSANIPTKLAAVSGAAIDSDGDALLDLFDTDDDGDGIIDIADSSVDVASTQEVDTGVETPFTTLYLSMNETINWHINGALDPNDIEAVIGGENKFAIAYFFGFSPDDTVGASVESGEAICPDALEYCRPASAGASTSVYSGFSEGDPALQGQLWSALNFGLEELPVFGGGGSTWGAAIQPRVGTDKFRAGDTYRVDFKNSSGTVVIRKALTLPPYFVTVPALRAYNTTSDDAAADVLVDYSNPSGPGTSQSNPIVIPNAGLFAGKLRLNVWRLQRAAVTGLESGEYRDFGHLNYGVIINNNSGEFTCGELYSNISSTLTELPSAGQGGGYSSNTGALLWPLVDSANDYEPSSATDENTIGANTISFTVNLEACLSRNGLSAGVHALTLTAAGADTGRGANRGAQTIYFQTNPL
jgi:hypothetical protein